MQFRFIELNTNDSSTIEKLSASYEELNIHSCNDRYLTSSLQVLPDAPQDEEFLCVYDIDSMAFKGASFILLTSIDYNGDRFEDFVNALIKGLKKNEVAFEIKSYLIDVSDFYFYAHTHDENNEEFTVKLDLTTIYEDSFILNKNTKESQIFYAACDEMALVEYIDEFMLDILEN